MSHKVPDKRRSRSFSLNDAEFKAVQDLAKVLGLKNRNDLTVLLVEAARALALLPVIDRESRKIVLRPNGEVDWQAALFAGKAKKEAVLRGRQNG